MTEYSLEFSEKLAETAQSLVTSGLKNFATRQTVLYLSLLSAEISLKALLEKAGKPIGQIRARSHNLSQLLMDLSACEIYKEIAPGVPHWISASEVRGVTVDPAFGNGTIGTLIEGEKYGASKYPNRIRYGNKLKHFPPEAMSEMALKLITWAKLHFDTIRLV
ncbi:hypothetical protein [Geothrix edaphica]|jgi:hypothetical protein|nr:hypothetical protein [Geothrix edaphica]